MKRPSSITAIVTVVMVAVLSFSICCDMPMQSRGCCSKGHCVSAAAPGALVAVPRAKFCLPTLTLAAVLRPNLSPQDGSNAFLPGQTLFEPIATIQLRI